MQKKYGKFHFKDYISGWIATLIFFLIMCFGINTDLHILLLVLPTLLFIYFPLSIIIPNQEKFAIHNDVITIKKITKTQQFIIPDNCVIVVAYADFCPFFVKRFQTGNQTYMLKERCSVTILQNNSIDYVLDKLHHQYAKRYTTTSVEKSFDTESDLIYSFVCTNEQLENLIKDRKCQVIIPETLKNKVNLKKTGSATIIYDEGFWTEV